LGTAGSEKRHVDIYWIEKIAVTNLTRAEGEGFHHQVPTEKALAAWTVGGYREVWVLE